MPDLPPPLTPMPEEFTSAEQFYQHIRVRSLFSPYFFTRTVLGYDRLVPHLHQHDNELFIRRLTEGHRYQFIEWPRRFYKTTTFTLGTGIWLTCPVTQQDTDFALGVVGLPEGDWFSRVRLHDQNMLQLIAMETDENAKKKVGWIKNQFESNELFRACFPEIAYKGDEEPWNMSGIKIRRIGNRRFEQEGTFDAIGVGVSLQSRHYDVVWEDDLVGERAIKSAIEMERTIEWHSRLDGAFVDPATQMRFGVSNRWGYNDLNSWIRTNEPGVIFYTRKAYEIDAATGAEVPIFPERFPMAELLAMKARMRPYDFNCQMLNSPQLPGEKELDFTKLHRHTREDTYIVRCSCGRTYDIRHMLVYMSLDPSQARVASTSKNCIALVGTTTDKHVFLLDVWQRKAGYDAVFKMLISFNDAYRPDVFTYEDVGSQNMLQYHLEQLQSKNEFREGKIVDPERPLRGGHRRFRSIRPMPTKSKKKEDRIKDYFLPKIETYRFSYNGQMEWGRGFVKQLETFPFPCPDHDYDLLDALAQGALVWRFPEDEDTFRSRKNEEDEYMRHLGKPYSGIMNA